jgi:hypothetical protein
MQIPKEQILALLRDQNEPGDPGKADQAERELPQQVDTDNAEHQNLLEQYGIDAGQLLKKLTGGSFGF